MKLIQGGKKDPAINEQDWKFIKTSLRQCIATKFITESEKEATLNYLETTEEADLTVRGLMAGSQSVTSFVLSLLQACLLYTSPSPRDAHESRMPSSA